MKNKSFEQKLKRDMWTTGIELLQFVRTVQKAFLRG